MRRWLAALALFAGTAGAQDDVGLVSSVSGNAAYQDGQVKAYMKVREGDRFELPAGARLSVIYFASARQERWQGPAQLAAGKRESKPLAGKAPGVTTLPASASLRLERVPELARSSLFGGTAVRASPQRTETEDTLREARATYEGMKRQLPADDPTPELFLLAALAGGPDPNGAEAKSLAARLRDR